MSSVTHFLLLTHPGLGEGLLEAAESILGHPAEVQLVTNQDLSTSEVETRITVWLDAAQGPCIIFTDLAFGSLCQAAQKAAKGRKDVGIVSGVNLPVLLAGLRSSAEGSMQERLKHIAERGSGGVETFVGEDR